MTPIDAAWLASFLDGEGSFMVTRSTRADCMAPVYEAVVAARNTNRLLVQQCQELCGGRIVTTRPKNARHKDAHIWQLKGMAVGPVVEAVLPYLISKIEQAKLLLELRALTRRGSPRGRFGTRKTEAEVAARSALYERARELNKRGNPEYARMARDRIKAESPLFAEVA